MTNEELQERIAAAIAVVNEPVQGLHDANSWKNIYATKLNLVRSILEGKERS
jgi:hypothetical protein